MSDWLELDRAHVWHPYTQMLTAPTALPVVAAEGAHLLLADGRRLFDGISSWWVNLHGHAHPRLRRALAAQADRLEQVIFAGFSHEPAARLAAELVALAPPGLGRVFFSDDGSTAVEVAMKMALGFWRRRGEPDRTLFLALEHAYHGDTFGAMAAGGGAVFHGDFAGLLLATRRAPVPAAESEVAAALAIFEERLLAEPGRFAAAIVEPIVQGAGGMRIHPPSFLAGVREITRRHALPLIVDEIFTGFGRTGRMLASEHAAIAPDLLCLSKGLTGGCLPLAATLASEEIYAAFLSPKRGDAFFHGHSYTANPLACAVARASLALFAEERTLARVARLETLFADRLARLAGLPQVGTTRGIGALAVIEVAPRAGAAAGYLDERGPRLAAALLARGQLLRPLGDVLYLLPPYCASDDDCHRAFDAIEEALAELPVT